MPGTSPGMGRVRRRSRKNTRVPVATGAVGGSCGLTLERPRPRHLRTQGSGNVSSSLGGVLPGALTPLPFCAARNTHEELRGLQEKPREEWKALDGGAVALPGTVQHSAAETGGGPRDPGTLARDTKRLLQHGRDDAEDDWGADKPPLSS